VPIVGRDGLVGRLRSAVEAAQGGEGRMVVLSGEAGAGKTAVVREVVAGLPWGYCEPLDTPRPLGPVRDIARQLPFAPEDADPVAAGEQMLGALRAGGTALVIEDAHWIDAASADVLRFLGRRIGSAGGALLVTFRCRSPDSASPSTTTCRPAGRSPSTASRTSNARQ
jgi:predicted ATPase